MKNKSNATSLNRYYKSVSGDLIAIKKDKEIVRPGIWSSLSKSEKAVLPVILRYSDNYGKAHPGEDHIANISGLRDRKTVRRATRKLINRGIIKVTKSITGKGHFKKKYQLDQSYQKVKDHGLNLPAVHFDGGNWAGLRPAAKSLALVFWYFSEPDPKMDPEYYHLDRWLNPHDYKDYLKKREADSCSAETSILCEFAGISPRSFKPALNSLKKFNFIDDHPIWAGCWLVYVYPKETNSKILAEKNVW